MSRRGVFNTEAGVVVKDMPDADPAQGARVRVTSVGICSTDFWVMAMGPSPFVIGHEFAGHLDDGTLAAIYPLARCGECDQCAKGAYNRCRRIFELSMGLGTDGGMCTELYAGEDSITRLPASVRPEDAFMVEPTAVAIHAIDRAGLEPGQRVAVIGAGPLGLVAATAIRTTGCDTDIATRHPHQRAAAEQLGLGVEVSGEYDVVVDAAGNESALFEAAERLAPGGVLLLLAFYPPAGVNFPATTLLTKEANVVTSTAYCCSSRADDFASAAEFLVQHPELTPAITTHRFALDDAAAAFAAAQDRAAGAIKVAVEPGG